MNKNPSKTIVILGGSFNPPTVAHAAVLDHAMTQTSADVGLFVPSSDMYVERKLNRQHKKAYKAPGVIPFAQRMAMCRIYANLYNSKEKPMMAVSNAEVDGSAWGNTYTMLNKIQEQHPDSRLIFIIGDDKLGVLHKWGNIEKLLSRFQMAVLPRKTSSEEEIRKILESHPETASHLDSFAIIPPVESSSEDLSDISSSAFWESVLNPGSEKSPLRYVDRDVYEMTVQWKKQLIKPSKGLL